MDSHKHCLPQYAAHKIKKLTTGRLLPCLLYTSVLGRQEPVSTAHGMDYTVNPIEGLELSDQLHDAVKYIHGTYQEAELPELGEGEAIDTSIPADPNVKNYSYAIVDRENRR